MLFSFKKTLCSYHQFFSYIALPCVARLRLHVLPRCGCPTSLLRWVLPRMFLVLLPWLFCFLIISLAGLYHAQQGDYMNKSRRLCCEWHPSPWCLTREVGGTMPLATPFLKLRSLACQTVRQTNEWDGLRFIDCLINSWLICPKKITYYISLLKTAYDDVRPLIGQFTIHISYSNCD